MARRIDGRSLAAAIRRTLPPRIAKLPRQPGLAVILVGNDPASELYVRLKQRAAGLIGVLFQLERYPATVSTATILKKIDEWNANPQVDALLIQLPLPTRLNENVIIERLDPNKDVDGFHPVNTARYLNGERTYPPGLVEGIRQLIQSTGRRLAGLSATIVARPSVFTQCLEHALGTIKVKTEIVPADGKHHNATLNADILVVAAGRPGLIKGEDVKPDAIVIDVGINTLPNGKIVGDVDVKSVQPVASWLTPVPGGVGPMTIAMLLENVVRLAERNEL